MKNSMNIFPKIAMALAVIILGSCSQDFLDIAPQQSVRTEEAITNLGDLEAAVTGIYDQFQNSDYYGRYFVLVPDVMSDDVKQNASANRAKEWAEYSGNSTDFIPEEIWAEIYEAIDRANRVIIEGPNADIPATVQDQADQYIGEAYALRAQAHFDLVRIYGQHYGFSTDNSHAGIPIVIDVEPFRLPSRNTVADVYTQVVADFNTAIPLLKVSPGVATRISQNAARALLARVHLYMGDWSTARDLANTVISSGEFTMVDNANYTSYWANEGVNSVESIWEISMTSTDNNGSDALGGMYLGTGYGDYLPSTDLLNLIPASDVRNQLYSDDQTIGGIYGNLRVAKYPSTIGENNTKAMRISELYLIRAEAEFNLGNSANAQSDVTLIRQRADPSAAAVTSTGQALLDDIRLERRLELCFEGQRLWDLMRFKENVVRNDCTSITCTVTYPNDRFVLPIPLVELDTNPNAAQNPGY